MDFVNTSDGDLVQQVMMGTEGAFECLYKRYNPSLNNLLGALHQIPHEDREDILQMSWLKVHRYISTFISGRSLQNWLYQIARNTARTCYRQNTNGETRVIALADTNDEGATIVIDKRTGKCAYQPLDILLIHERLQAVMEKMETLPELDQDIMRCRFINGMSQKETAEALAIEDTLVNTRVRRTRKKLAFVA